MMKISKENQRCVSGSASSDADAAAATTPAAAQDTHSALWPMEDVGAARPSKKDDDCDLEKGQDNEMVRMMKISKENQRCVSGSASSDADAAAATTPAAAQDTHSALWPMEDVGAARPSKKDDDCDLEKGQDNEMVRMMKISKENQRCVSGSASSDADAAAATTPAAAQDTHSALWPMEDVGAARPSKKDDDCDLEKGQDNEMVRMMKISKENQRCVSGSASSDADAAAATTPAAAQDTHSALWPMEDVGAARPSKKDDDCDLEKGQDNEIVHILRSPIYPKKGDHIQVFYGPSEEFREVYEAKVLKVMGTREERVYLVHYVGWNSRFDEWIAPRRIAAILTTKDTSLESETYDADDEED